MVRCRGPFFAYFEPGSTDRYNIVCGGYNHRRRVSVWHLHRQVFLRGGGISALLPFWTAQTPEYYLQDIWHGTFISKALESIGEDGSYKNRQQIAAANGITGYTGTAEQNTHLLNLLRTGQLIRV